MKTLLTFLIILKFSIIGIAQTSSISGVVLDDSDSLKVEFASVILFSSVDSTMVDGIITNSDGFFVLEGIPDGTYYLKVKFIGYELLFIENLKLNADNPTVNLGVLTLKPSALAAIEVTGNASVFEVKIDKKIFNAEKSMISKGRNGLDFLRQIPTISVDQNDNILLRGDANVTVLIDGRPTALPANQLLKQMSASLIEKVEIITNPSARYDPEGTSGIINIILKREDTVGFNSTINGTLGYGIFPKIDGGINLNYRNKKLNIYGNYAAYFQKHWSRDIQNVSSISDSIYDGLRSNEYYENTSMAHNGSIGLDYFLNDYNTFYLSGSRYIYEADYLGNVEFLDMDINEGLQSRSNRLMNIDTPGSGFTLNTGWQKNFKKEGNTLDLDLNFNQSDNPERELYTHDYFDNANNLLTTNYQRTDNYYLYQTLLGKLDYVINIDSSIQIETGFHFTGRYSNLKLDSRSALADGVFTPDTNISNQFDYDQETYAPYFSLSKQFKKVGLKAGVRAEQTFTDGFLITTDEKFEDDYFKLFPSVHLSYTTEKNSEFQISYSKRINRPEYDQLNPFNGFWDLYTIERGNPDLRPEIIHVNELNYIKFWEKFNISGSIYYRYITNLIRRKLSNDGVYSLIQYVNLGTSSLSGGDVSIAYMPIDKLRIMATTTIWNSSTKDNELTNGERESFFGFFNNFYITYKAKKGFSFETWGSYSPKVTTFQGEFKSYYTFGLGIGKQIFNEKGSINFTCNDILKSQHFTFISAPTPNYNFYSKSTMETRTFFLTFSYSFGKIVDGKNRRFGDQNDGSDSIITPDIE